MRKYIAIIFLFFFSTNAIAKTTIHMEQSGGVFKIPCVVNGAKMKMIFDTGASVVSLSKNMAEYLLENEFLSSSDIIGKSYMIVADGSRVESVTINIRDLEIAGLHLYDVKAVVSSSQSAPLLLGQSAIQKLGPVTIEGSDLIIDIGSSYSIDEIMNLDSLLLDYMVSGFYNSAMEYLTKMENLGFFSDTFSINDEYESVIRHVQLRSMISYTYCLNETENFNKAIQIGEKIMTKFDNEITQALIHPENSDYLPFIKTYFSSLINSYLNTNDYLKAISLYDKSIIINKDNDFIIHLLLDKASCYSKLNNFQKTEETYCLALHQALKFANIHFDNLSKGNFEKINTDDIVSTLTQLCTFYIDNNKYEEACDCMFLSAICGDKIAIESVKESDIEYSGRFTLIYNKYKFLYN